MSLPPIMFYAGGRRVQRPRLRPIANADGLDIRDALTQAASSAGVPLALPLACAMAESNLTPRAERWGRRTQEARAALARGDREQLQNIIDATWPDVSFGYGQRIVKYHWVGDRSSSVENVLRVRQYVFEHPKEDLQHMARWLASTLATARRSDLRLVDGDELLGALLVYNAGHFPRTGESYWQTHAGNVENYKRALRLAKDLLGG